MEQIFVSHEPVLEHRKTRRQRLKERFSSALFVVRSARTALWLSWVEDVRYFWHGVRLLVDLTNIAFFTRITRSEVEEMRALAVSTGRTPPQGFAMFVGISTTLVVLLYAFKFGLPWPMNKEFAIRSGFLFWQAFRLCVFLGSMVVGEQVAPKGRKTISLRSNKRKDIPEDELLRWRGTDEL